MINETTSIAKKKNTKENIIRLPRALQRSVYFPNLSVEVQVKQATIQREKSEVSLHILISNWLHSVIIYSLHGNLMFKLKNLAAAQFDRIDISVKGKIPS